MVKFSSDVEAADALAGTYKNLAKEISNVIVGQDEAISLLIGLVVTSITLLIDVIARVKESEEKMVMVTD